MLWTLYEIPSKKGTLIAFSSRLHFLSRVKNKMCPQSAAEPRTNQYRQVVTTVQATKVKSVSESLDPLYIIYELPSKKRALVALLIILHVRIFSPESGTKRSGNGPWKQYQFFTVGTNYQSEVSVCLNRTMLYQLPPKY